MSELSSRTLRPWQRTALTQFLQSKEVDFAVTATPGAGKTTFALSAAKLLLASKAIKRVIVVVPTDHLRTQWGDAAADLGLMLDSTLENNGTLTEDFDGYVCTYAQVALAANRHRRRCEQLKTLVILDEVHHAGDGLSWGEAILEAFNPASRRLVLTGTPFRTSSKEKISFVRYEDDGNGVLKNVSDYTYGYAHGLRDGVVRPVMFAAYSGVARWRNSAGEVLSGSLSEPASKEQEMAAWKTILKPDGRWIPHVIAAADARLTEIRKAGMKDAGGIILASNQEMARAYARVVKEMTGEKPTVVLSDDPKASSQIDAFNKGTQRWLVAVRMVSEGVDVPRLAVLCWLTSYRTPLFFAQAVGRVVRARQPGESATVFLPAIRPLLALAAELEKERDHVIEKGTVEGEDPEIKVRAEATEGGTDIEHLDADAEFAHILFGGKATLADDIRDENGSHDDFLGLPGLLSPEQTASLLKKRETEMRAKAFQVSGTAPTETVWTAKQIRDLRLEVHKLVSRYAHRSGIQHATVHSNVRKAVPGPPSAQATGEILMARRDWLLSKLA